MSSPPRNSSPSQPLSGRPKTAGAATTKGGVLSPRLLPHNTHNGNTTPHQRPSSSSGTFTNQPTSANYGNLNNNNSTSSSTTGNTPAHRRAVKKAEARALEFAATPILLSLADKRLRTQTRSSSMTILGTTLQTTLPRGLALYKEIVDLIHKMGMFQTSYGTTSLFNGNNNNNVNNSNNNNVAITSVSSATHSNSSRNQTPLPSSNNNNAQQQQRTPTPPPAASQQQQQSLQYSPTNNTNNNNNNNNFIQHHLPFGIHSADAPMIAQGKLLEAWASFLGGETRRIARQQAILAKETTAKISKQVEENEKMHSKADLHNLLSTSTAGTDDESPDRTNNNHQNQKTPSSVISNSINKDNNNVALPLSSSALTPLLCEVAQPGVDYPSVILRALEVEEAARNPKAELELYCNHYRGLLERGEASNEGTVRELETSVFVTLTESLLSLVQIATLPKTVSSFLPAAASGGGGGGGNNNNNNNINNNVTFAMNNNNNSPTNSGRNFNTNSNAHSASNSRPGTQHNFNNNNNATSRPTSASSLYTTARPHSARTPSVMLMMNNNNNNNYGGGVTSNSNSNTTTTNYGTSNTGPVVPPIFTTVADFEFQQQQNNAIGATLPVARVVCRPNSARALNAARKAPKGIIEDVCLSAKLSSAASASATTSNSLQQNGNSKPDTSIETLQQLFSTQQQNQSHLDGNTANGAIGGPRPPYQNGNNSNNTVGRITLNQNWRGPGKVDVTVGVGNAARHVGPTATSSNWNQDFSSHHHYSQNNNNSNNIGETITPTNAANGFGHQSFKQYAKPDKNRPRHGKAIQTEKIQSNVSVMANTGNSNNSYTLQNSNVLVNNSGNNNFTSANTRGGGAMNLHSVNSMPTNWNQHRDEKWVLAP